MNAIKKKILGVVNREKWLFSEGAWVFLVKLLNVGLTFLVSVAMARILGTRGFGLFTQVLAIINVIGAPTEIGLPQLMVRETARLAEGSQWGAIRGLWQWAATTLLTTSAVFIIGYPILRPFLGSLVKDELHSVLVWAMMLVPLLGLNGIVSSAIRGFHKVAIAQIGEQVLMPLVFLSVALTATYVLNVPATPQIAIWYQVGAAVLSVVWAFTILFRVSPHQIFTAVASFQNNEWLKSTLGLASITGMQVINKWMSVIIVSYFVKYAELGVYRVAVQIAILADLGRLVMYPILSPQIAKTFANNDLARLQSLAKLSARLIVLVNTGIYFLFILFGKYFVNFFYGREYKEAYLIVIILVTGQFFDSITGASSLFLTMTGFERDTARIRFATTSLNMVLMVVFSSMWGIIGAAFAASVTLVIWNVMVWILVKRKLGISCLPI